MHERIYRGFGSTRYLFQSNFLAARGCALTLVRGLASSISSAAVICLEGNRPTIGPINRVARVRINGVAIV